MYNRLDFENPDTMGLFSLVQILDKYEINVEALNGAVLYITRDTNLMKHIRAWYDFSNNQELLHGMLDLLSLFTTHSMRVQTAKMVFLELTNIAIHNSIPHAISAPQLSKWISQLSTLIDGHDEFAESKVIKPLEEKKSPVMTDANADATGESFEDPAMTR